MKKPVLLGAAVLLYGALQAQCVLPSTESDSLFPVTNKPGASVYHIAADKGTYYLMGNFTNLVQNQGPALVVDTATNAVRTPRKWRVDGTVTAAVDDGRGGYFLAGNFSRIGDSVRRYLAQIDAQGQPTAWNPQPDEAVKALHRKGDTLFMAGAFSSVFRQHRENLALYSLSGDSLLRIAGPNQPSLRMSVINCFVVHNDTLIYGGDGSWGDHSLRKFNLKDNQVLPWTLAYTEYGPVTSLQLSSDSATIVYVSNYNSDHIMGADARTGAELYRIEVDMAPVSGMGPGYVPGLKVVGDKAYAVGYFEQVVSHYSKLSRKGFFAFNPRTGVILQDDLKSDGYLSFLHPSGGRLFVSGDFTRVSGVGRNNFAVVDTGTLAVGPWQLAPSDALTALAFSGGHAFVGGHFNGVNAVRRNGFAAIDSATNVILPWSPVNPGFTEGRKVLVQGDSLFVLGITARPNSCMINDFNTALHVISLKDGAVLSASSLGFSRINDMLIDSNYLYVAGDHQLRRFSLPSLVRDPAWGVDWTGAGGDHAPMCVLMQGNEIYTVGDNRFVQPCTTLPQRTGWFMTYDKATGHPTRYHAYKAPNPYYDQVTFDHAVLAKGLIYVQGYFHVLNGVTRHNFMALDVATGAITDWVTPFSNTGLGNSFQTTSPLKLHGGKLWFGSTRFNSPARPGEFTGFGAIDTATGDLLPALFDMDRIFYGIIKTNSFHDFIFHGNSFVAVGDFDLVNGVAHSNIVRTPLVVGAAPTQTGSAVEGPDTLYIGTADKSYFVLDGDRTQNAYSWSYSGSGVEVRSDGSNAAWLSAVPGATGGVLTVRSRSYCGAPTELQKAIAVVLPPLPPIPVITGIGNKCQNENDTRAKLVNPPADVTVSITQNGTPLTYNAADSSFQYFSTWLTPGGTHTISVQYTNAAGVSQKDSAYTVSVPPHFSVSIATPSTSICSGVPVTFTATTVNGGDQVDYQWQVHGVNVGENSPTFTTSALFHGALVKVVAKREPACVVPWSQTSNTITMTVHGTPNQSLTINGASVVNKGHLVPYEAVLTNGGSNPAYRWQDSTAAHDWRDLGGATYPNLVYTPLNTGDKLRCIVSSSNGCAIDTSNVITLTVHDVSTAINPVAAGSYGIRWFPNPVGPTLYIDSLRVMDKWQTLELFSMDGRQKMLVAGIQGKKQLAVPVAHLPNGYYVALLRRRSGEAVYFRLLKL